MAGVMVLPWGTTTKYESLTLTEAKGSLASSPFFSMS